MITVGRPGHRALEIEYHKLHNVSSRERSGKKRLGPAQKWIVALGLLMLVLALGNLGRAVMALRYAARLPDLPMTVSWSYLAAMSSFWGAVFVVCALGLFRFRVWGRWLALAALTFWQAHIWLNHLLFDASDYARQTHPRDLLLTVLLLAFFWVSLSLRCVRRSFG